MCFIVLFIPIIVDNKEWEYLFGNGMVYILDMLWNIVLHME